MIRQLLHVLGIIAAWFLGATVVGAIIAMFVEVHGSILYVIIELCNVNRAFGKKALVTWGVALGVFAGFATDWILGITGA